MGTPGPWDWPSSRLASRGFLAPAGSTPPVGASRARPAMARMATHRPRASLDFMYETSEIETGRNRRALPPTTHSQRRCLIAGYMRLQRSGNTQAGVLHADARGRRIAICGAEQTRIVIPGTAAQDT